MASASRPATPAAGTVEFLVGEDGTISFLEVNTRLQVEHPVSEETSRLDLVREQFRIANGEELRFTGGPRAARALDRVPPQRRGRGPRLPARPRHRDAFVAPSGPGVRVDAGVESGSVIGGQFDSMVGKLIVTGEDREQALQRSRRALDEIVVEGLATVIPFHRPVVTDPAFTAPDGASSFTVHTRWIETEWENTVRALRRRGCGRRRRGRGGRAADGRRRGRRQAPRGLTARRALPRRRGRRGGAGGREEGARGRRGQGRREGLRGRGDLADAGHRREGGGRGGRHGVRGRPGARRRGHEDGNPVTAHKDGTVTGLAVEAGASVNQGAVICEIAG